MTAIFTSSFTHHPVDHLAKTNHRNKLLYLKSEIPVTSLSLPEQDCVKNHPRLSRMPS